MSKLLIRVVTLLGVALITVSCAGREVIPPCTPVEDSGIDPCRVGDRQHKWTGVLVDILGQPEPPAMREYLDGLFPRNVTHIVVRGTILPGTIRCAAYKIRALSMDDFRFLEGTDKLRCYVDVRANEYIVGTGPAVLTIEYLSTIREVSPLNLARLLAEGGKDEVIEVPSRSVAGREWVFFLGPDIDIGVEAWVITHKWDVQHLPDGSIVAALPGHTNRDVGVFYFEEPNLEALAAAKKRPLHVFVSEVKMAHRERIREHRGRIGGGFDQPRLVWDAGELGDYLRAVGAYDHPDGPPVLPPAP